MSHRNVTSRAPLSKEESFTTCLGLHYLSLRLSLYIIYSLCCFYACVCSGGQVYMPPSRLVLLRLLAILIRLIAWCRPPVPES